jgi:hypothetical protein
MRAVVPLWSQRLEITRGSLKSFELYIPLKYIGKVIWMKISEVA